ncbi:TolC family protein [Methylomicrobium sp. RS1]|jgi:cobalt-zinc-cadmium efflux system outer membrane protein|uniref:TolC family protein n=1 Tax=Candidatus Methylomicrobium oryzae TaxID=2802053 RepID=UPI0019239E09|nr:TolC family protein [Methylomicrobium sp. RS1]MBL1262108.1 TolC family protein [Methylomicrobium sp. RS1]
MNALNFYPPGRAAAALGAALLSFVAQAEDIARPPEFHRNIKPTIDHFDPIEVDPALNLAKVINLTLEKYPDSAWLAAQEAEAAAILERSKSWTSGAARAGLAYQEATSGTLHYIDAVVQVPLWNLGQRDAERSLADRAQADTESQSKAVHLRVAGLIRTALWDMELQKVRHQQALAEVDTYGQLFDKIRRRVELGDLPEADLLLAETELLQKRSALTLAEAEFMHARKRYATITQTSRIPAEFNENLAELGEIQKIHPALAALDSQIERKKAQIEALRLTGSGQPDLMLGINSDRPSDNDPRSNKTESFNIAVSVPFGGSAHLQPQIAALQVEESRLLADYQQLYRDLELVHHEAEHNLEVNKAELKIAEEMRQVAEAHMRMIEISFSAGEIDLMDLLRVKARTQQAILNAKERSVILQRDIALYNQAVGVMP